MFMPLFLLRSNVRLILSRGGSGCGAGAGMIASGDDRLPSCSGDVALFSYNSPALCIGLPLSACSPSSLLGVRMGNTYFVPYN